MHGSTALHLAAKHGHWEVVTALLDENADPTLKNQYGITALELAEKEGRTKVAELIRNAMENHLVDKDDEEAANAEPPTKVPHT